MKMVWRVVFGRQQEHALYFTDRQTATNCTVALGGMYGAKLDRVGLTGSRRKLDAKTPEEALDFYYANL